MISRTSHRIVDKSYHDSLIQSTLTIGSGYSKRQSLNMRCLCRVCWFTISCCGCSGRSMYVSDTVYRPAATRDSSDHAGRVDQERCVLGDEPDGCCEGGIEELVGAYRDRQSTSRPTSRSCSSSFTQIVMTPGGRELVGSGTSLGRLMQARAT